jgi:hypothetical protein
MADSKNKTPFYLIDTQSDFYRPLSRRIVICVAVALWAGLETWHRDPFWSVISVACAAYCIYVLFWTYKPPAGQSTQPADPEPSAAHEIETPADANSAADRAVDSREADRS